MALKPDQSLLGSIAVMTMVYATYEMALPSVVDQRVAPSQDSDLASSERSATWIAAGTVAIVSLLARDPTIFTLGGLSVIGLAWWHRHANAVNPLTGSAATYQPRAAADEGYDETA